MAKNISNHHRVDNESTLLENVLFILGHQWRRIQQSVKRFLWKLSRTFEYGQASLFYIDLYENQIVSRDEMLRKLDELDERFIKEGRIVTQ